jgi:hypothetical protein
MIVMLPTTAVAMNARQGRAELTPHVPKSAEVSCTALEEGVSKLTLQT